MDVTDQKTAWNAPPQHWKEAAAERHVSLQCVVSNRQAQMKMLLSCSLTFSAVVSGLLRVIIWIGVYTHGMENVEFFDVVLSTGDVQGKYYSLAPWSTLLILVPQLSRRIVFSGLGSKSV